MMSFSPPSSPQPQPHSRNQSWLLHPRCCKMVEENETGEEINDRNLRCARKNPPRSKFMRHTQFCFQMDLHPRSFCVSLTVSVCLSLSVCLSRMLCPIIPYFRFRSSASSDRKFALSLGALLSSNARRDLARDDEISFSFS